MQATEETCVVNVGGPGLPVRVLTHGVPYALSVEVGAPVCPVALLLGMTSHCNLTSNPWYENQNILPAQRSCSTING